MKRILFALISAVVLLSACCSADDCNAGVKPLSVDGQYLVNSDGERVVLNGVSYAWHNWWSQFYNEGSVAELVNVWGAEVVRAAMGVEPSGSYLDRAEWSEQTICTVVDAAIANNVYVIIDFHSHNIREAEAIEFFTKMATKYKGVPNVIYEIFNEPDNETWPEVKAYSIAVIDAIRAIEPDAVILVGTPTWSQDVDIAADDPIEGYSNLMYVLHFYAATHKQSLRDKADYALAKGLPIFVSECGGMLASGDGPLDIASWNEWKEWMQANSLSWAAWSLSSKDETCSMLTPSAPVDGGWGDGDLKEWALIIKEHLESRK